MNLYAINTSSPAAYVPATWHGGWTTSSSAAVITKMIEPTTKWALNGASTTSVTGSGAGPITVAFRRFVSRKLAAQTIAGTLDVVLGALQALSTDEFVWKCYAWVSVGDTDVERGVVLDYTEVLGVGGATAFPTTRTGKSFASAQALTSVNALEGDRLIIEIGGSTTTVTGGNHTGSVEVGAWGSSGAAYADLAAAETPTTARAGFFVYSGTLTLSATEPTNISPSTAQTYLIPSSITPSPAPTFQSLELWYAYAPGASDLVVSVFAGRDVASTYEPLLSIFRGPIDGSFTELYPSQYNNVDQPYVLRTPGGITTYLRVISVGSGAIAGSISLVSVQVPLLPAGNYHGYILITPDSSAVASADQFTYVINGTTGVTVGVVLGTTPSENGAMIGYAQRWLSADENNLDELVLFNALTLVEILRITGVVSGSVGSGFTPISASGDTFYVAQYRADLGGIIRLTAISVDGVVGTTWDMTAPSGNQIFGMWTTYTNTVAYYSRFATNQPVKRWDLVNDVALADFLAADPARSPREILVLRDNSVLIMWDGTGPGAIIERYDALGVLLNTYDPLGDTGGAATFLDHFRQGTDDPVSFWAWAQNSTTHLAYLIHYRVADGVVLSQVAHPLFSLGLLGPEVAPGDLPDYMYGPPDSCPLLLVLTEGPAGPGPGPSPDCPGRRTVVLPGV